jgi:hypothetical protein
VSDYGRKHILTAAWLRGQGRFTEAIAEIENNFASFDEIMIVPALLQALYAANENNDHPKAREIAQKLAKHDPKVRSVKDFLP